MRYFFAEQGRTRVFAEAYKTVRRRRKPAENDAQRKNSHFWMKWLADWSGKRHDQQLMKVKPFRPGISTNTDTDLLLLHIGP